MIFSFSSSWLFNDGGKEITQTLNSRAGLAVGSHKFSSVRFTGTLFVGPALTYLDNDVVGFIFGYQDNKNFYAVTSSKQGSRQVSHWIQPTPPVLQITNFGAIGFIFFVIRV